MDEVGFLAPEERDHGAQRAPLDCGREVAGERQRLDAEALGAGVGEQRAVSGDADDLVAARRRAAHEREQEVAQGKVDVGDFDDLHGPGLSIARAGAARAGGRYRPC